MPSRPNVTCWRCSSTGGPAAGSAAAADDRTRTRGDAPSWRRLRAAHRAHLEASGELALADRGARGGPSWSACASASRRISRPRSRTVPSACAAGRGASAALSIPTRRRSWLERVGGRRDPRARLHPAAAGRFPRRLPFHYEEIHVPTALPRWAASPATCATRPRGIFGAPGFDCMTRSITAMQRPSAPPSRASKDRREMRSGVTSSSS